MGFGIGGECGERIKGEGMGYYDHSKGNAIEIAHRDYDGTLWFRIITIAATNGDGGR